MEPKTNGNSPKGSLKSVHQEEVLARRKSNNIDVSLEIIRKSPSLRCNDNEKEGKRNRWCGIKHWAQGHWPKVKSYKNAQKFIDRPQQLDDVVVFMESYLMKNNSAKRTSSRSSELVVWTEFYDRVWKRIRKLEKPTQGTENQANSSIIDGSCILLLPEIRTFSCIKKAKDAKR